MSTLRAELEAIHRQHRALSPRLVVDTARAPDHPLHSRFQWDDKKAGERYRLLQAAEMIRSIRVVYRTDPDTGEERRARAYVSTGDSNRPSEYKPTEEAMADPLTRKLVLRNFERAILALKRQYGHLQEYEQMMRTHGLGESTGEAA